LVWTVQFKKEKQKGNHLSLFRIYYGEEPLTIYIAFERDWSKDIYMKYRGERKEEIIFISKLTIGKFLFV